MSTADEEITRLYKIRRTLMEMLKDRKYLIPNSDLLMTRQEFIAKCQENVRRGDNISFSYAKESDSIDQIYVFFPADFKAGMPVIKTLVERMKQGSFSRAILVVQQKLTPSARTFISGLVSAKFHIEVFQEEELLVNISKHALVPPHEVLTDEEKKSLLKKYAVKEAQLPRIQVTDPIARYHGMKRGQIVKITRDSETAGKYITYRCDAYTPQGVAIPTNKRAAAAKVFSHPEVVAEVPWYGIEQEYTLLQKEVNWPIGRPASNMDPYVVTSMIAETTLLWKP